RDVGHGDLRHVAADTVARGRGCGAVRLHNPLADRRVTLLALLIEIGRGLSAGQSGVRIMTGDTVQLAAVRLSAAAHAYLFGLAERLKAADLQCWRHQKDGNHIIERRAGTKIKQALSGPLNARIAAQMALVTDI